MRVLMMATNESSKQINHVQINHACPLLEARGVFHREYSRLEESTAPCASKMKITRRS